MSEKKTVHTYSGQGKHLENAVLFIGCFVFLLLGLYLLGTYPEGGPVLYAGATYPDGLGILSEHDGWFWYAGALVCYGLFFGLVFHVLPSKTTRVIKDVNKVQD